MSGNIQWANNENISDAGHAWDGQPTKTEPTSQMKDTGFVPNKPIPANILNWLLHEYGTQILDLQLASVYPEFHSVSLSGSFVGAVSNRVSNTLWAFGNDSVQNSQNAGISWTDASSHLASGPTTPSKSLTSGVCDAAGSTYFSSADSEVWQVTSGGSWAGVPMYDSGTGFAFNTIMGRFVYEPVADSLVWIGYSSEPNYFVASRTNPSAHFPLLTPHGVPSAFDNTKTSYQAAADGAGRVLVFTTGGTSSKIVYSDDGGATWVAGAVLTHVVTGAQCTGLAMLSDGTWAATVAGNTNDSGSEVWTSTDRGITWTKAASFTTTGMFALAAYRGVLLALGGVNGFAVGTLLISLDKGETWDRLNGFFASLAGLSVVNGRVYGCGTAQLLISNAVTAPDVTPVT